MAIHPRLEHIAVYLDIQLSNIEEMIFLGATHTCYPYLPTILLKSRSLIISSTEILNFHLT